jgi:5-formyltetrahydrofolate cyclo-ligase
MKYDKNYLRKSFIKKRNKNYIKVKSFNFDLIFSLIRKKFKKNKIVIAGYYPSNYEVDVLKFLKKAEEKNFKIALPVIKPTNKMDFKNWSYKEPLYVSKFGILEPKNSKKKIIPDLIIVPLVAFDKNLNRIGYGKGYYDRFLKKISKIKKKIISIGIAYSFQKSSIIPVNKYDFKLDYIFTERGIISSKN